MSEGGGAEIKHAETHQFSLVLFTGERQIGSNLKLTVPLDMNEEMLTEVQEMVIGLMEKLSPEKASKEAQQQLQKKYGNGWNVIIGKGYGAAVTAVKVI